MLKINNITVIGVFAHNTVNSGNRKSIEIQFHTLHQARTAEALLIQEFQAYRNGSTIEIVTFDPVTIKHV